MARSFGMLALILVVAAAVASAQEMKPVMGNWQGGFTAPAWQDRTLRAQIVGESGTDYRAVLYVGKKGEKEKRVEIKGKTKNKTTHFEGEVDLGAALGGVCALSGDAANEVFKGIFKSQGQEVAFELKRVLIKSPTLGLTPPEGAITLMAGEGKSREERQKTLVDRWNLQTRWVPQGDGSVAPTYSDIFTKESFGDAEYHVEFRTPYMPNERGQGRGNSGVYIEGKYEIQVLDSFADDPADNLCGGLYQMATPIVNACLPPLEWQTYDITFHAPRFDADGKKVKNAELTVKHNGILIHDHLSLPHTTPGGLGGKEAAQGQLLLQDHTNSVSYRNIWVKPIKN